MEEITQGVGYTPITDRFPPEWEEDIKDGPNRGTTYVPWHLYAKWLNDNRPGWSSAIITVKEAGAHQEVNEDGVLVQVAGQLIVGVQVSMNGVSHEALGASDADKTSWGRAFSEAYSQAFRRACAMHGLGLYMYHEEIADAEPAPEDAATDTQVERLRELYQAATEHEVDDVAETIKSLPGRWPDADPYLTKGRAGATIKSAKETLTEHGAWEEDEDPS